MPKSQPADVQLLERISDLHDSVRYVYPETQQSREDKLRLLEAIGEAIELGVYPKSTPTMKKNGYTHLQMVESYGHDWHVYRKPHKCQCGFDLRDKRNGPPYKLEIGHTDLRTDRTTHHECPKCGERVLRGKG
jgi:hypothetical protein